MHRGRGKERQRKRDQRERRVFFGEEVEARRGFPESHCVGMVLYWITSRQLIVNPGNIEGENEQPCEPAQIKEKDQPPRLWRRHAQLCWRRRTRCDTSGGQPQALKRLSLLSLHKYTQGTVPPQTAYSTIENALVKRTNPGRTWLIYPEECSVELLQRPVPHPCLL